MKSPCEDRDRRYCGEAPAASPKGADSSVKTLDDVITRVTAQIVIQSDSSFRLVLGSRVAFTIETMLRNNEGIGEYCRAVF